jgi:hypothetical protein
LCEEHYPDCSPEELDSKRVGELSYVGWYGRITDKKRVRA